MYLPSAWRGEKQWPVIKRMHICVGFQRPDEVNVRMCITESRIMHVNYLHVNDDDDNVETRPHANL